MSEKPKSNGEGGGGGGGGGMKEVNGPSKVKSNKSGGGKPAAKQQLAQAEPYIVRTIFCTTVLPMKFQIDVIPPVVWDEIDQPVWSWAIELYDHTYQKDHWRTWTKLPKPERK